MEDLHHVPQQAIEAFEQSTGMAICIHDRAHSLWFFLPPQRFQHQLPCCRATKLAGFEEDCMAFDMRLVHEELRQQHAGRVQICHAGLAECVVPVFFRDELEWVIFAGPRLPGNLGEVRRDSAVRHKSPPWQRIHALPAPMDRAEAERVLELLRQLAARLRAWREQLESSGLNTASQRPAAGAYSGPLQRREAVTRWILERHTRDVKLGDLARALHVSESRLSHVLREEFGRGFVDLLTEARLRTAAGLLRHSALPVWDVAARSGFRDLSHFHGIFREHFGLSPLQYRRQAEGS